MSARTRPATIGNSTAVLEGRADWSGVLCSGRRHRILALVHDTVHHACRDRIPPDVRRRLSTELHLSTAAALAKTAELRPVLEALSCYHIRAIAFKGPALATLAYPVPVLRRFNDLDLFVPPSHTAQAVEVLRAEGFIPDGGSRALRAPGANEIDLDNGRVALDLHWRFIPYYFPNFEPALPPIRVRFAGVDIPTLAPEDTLLHLAIHYGRKLWPTLSCVADVAWLIHSQPLDWDLIQARARRLRAVRLLSLALALASTLHPPIPDEIAARARNHPGVARLVQAVERRWDSLSEEDPAPLAEAAFHLRALDTFSQRVNYCLRRAFEPTQKDVAAVNLPRAATFLYYLVRPLRLALRVVPRPTTHSPEPAVFEPGLRGNADSARVQPLFEPSKEHGSRGPWR